MKACKIILCLNLCLITTPFICENSYASSIYNKGLALQDTSIDILARVKFLPVKLNDIEGKEKNILDSITVVNNRNQEISQTLVTLTSDVNSLKTIAAGLTVTLERIEKMLSKEQNPTGTTAINDVSLVATTDILEHLEGLTPVHNAAQQNDSHIPNISIPPETEILEHLEDLVNE